MNPSQNTPDDENSSINSSAILDNSSSFSQTLSITRTLTSSSNINVQKKPVDFSPVSKVNPDQAEYPIQKVRLQSKYEVPLLGETQVDFVGFVGFSKGNKKPIQINESKIKKAAHFFDDSPINSKQKSEINSSFESDSDTSENKDTLNGINKLDTGLSIKGCGFMNAGTGCSIEISEESSNRVKQFFEDLEQKVIESQKKPTKFKIPTRKQQNLLKTVTYEDKKKPNPLANPKHNPKSWKEKEIISQIKITKIAQNYNTISLADLPPVQQQAFKELKLQWSIDQQNDSFHHCSDECRVLCCYFCKKYGKVSIPITRQTFIKQIMQITDPHKSFKEGSLQSQNQYTLIRNLYIISKFKLLRYKLLYDCLQIYNKQYNPNNILLQILNKYNKIQDSCSIIQQITTFGPLALAIQKTQLNKKKVLGAPVNLVVVDINECIEFKYIYILLSDGWSFAYAVISSKNSLYQYLSNHENKKANKLKIGMKICISDWDFYLINNVLDYHPEPATTINNCKAIQFHYNNSKIICPSSRLGFTKELDFRPLSNYKVNGGLVPLVQGMIIRMFTRKTQKKTIQNIIEILSNSDTIFMKLSLPEEMALSDLFSLYQCYQFRRIKVGHQTGKERYLQYCDNSSYHEIKIPESHSKLQGLLKSRLLNINQNLKNKLEQSGHIIADLIVSMERFSFDGFDFEINERVMKSPSLLQQFMITKHKNDLLKVQRGQRGAIVSRIPKIYSNFQYKVF